MSAKASWAPPPPSICCWSPGCKSPTPFRADRSDRIIASALNALSEAQLLPLLSGADSSYYQFHPVAASAQDWRMQDASEDGIFRELYLPCRSGGGIRAEGSSVPTDSSDVVASSIRTRVAICRQSRFLCCRLLGPACPLFHRTARDG